jgi:hypothetical protein
MASDNKTLVIGSTGHAHVTCVEWSGLLEVNVVDFDLVVLTCRPLTKEFLNSLPWDFFAKVRKRLTRLLHSGGRVVALGVETQHANSGGDSRPHNSYSWSPIAVGTVSEAGDTIKILRAEFAPYLEKLQRWGYWYTVPSDCLTRELTEWCGGLSETKYNIDQVSLATNRYDKRLATIITIRATGKQSAAITTNFGPLVLLPDIPELDSGEGMNLVLEEILGLPQTTLPPAWAADLVVPGIVELDTAIEARQETIRGIKIEIATMVMKKGELEWFRKLVYETGTELEKVFSVCLERMGGSITPARYSQEEFVFEFEGQRSLVECKGVVKSASLTHLRQLTDYTLKYEQDEGAIGKGVLFVNAWRNLPLTDREKDDTLTFPANVIARASQLGIALVSSIGFFHAFCQFLEEKKDGAAILRLLSATNGVVNLG